MEKFFSDLRQTVSGAVKKSGELIELTKAKMAANDTKTAIKNEFVKLGELAYLAAKGEENPATDAEALVYKIDELKETLAEQEAKIAELGGKKICADCGKMVAGDSAFCPACGNSMESVD
ncbi:MAG: hypothetical protein IJF61_00915 [Clostridia bacterium]|nr:hypothetical protein [Clostridia bacterium]